MGADEQAIRDLIDRWHTATKEGDVQTVLGLMSEDAVFLVPGKAPMKGRDAFAQGLRSVLQSNRIESSGEIQEIEVSADLAYCINKLTVAIRPIGGAKENTRTGYTLTMFGRQVDGQWLLIRDANLLGVKE
jgi:uncharacterized protein (TIGR02246 family)